MNIKYAVGPSLLLASYLVLSHQNVREEAGKWRMKGRKKWNLPGILKLYFL